MNKTKEEIYLDEVKKCTEQLGEKFGKIVMSDAIRKFTLNCLMKMEDQQTTHLTDQIKSMEGEKNKLQSSLLDLAQKSTVKVLDLQSQLESLQKENERLKKKNDKLEFPD